MTWMRVGVYLTEDGEEGETDKGHFVCMRPTNRLNASVAMAVSSELAETIVLRSSCPPISRKVVLLTFPSNVID